MTSGKKAMTINSGSPDKAQLPPRVAPCAFLGQFSALYRHAKMVSSGRLFSSRNDCPSWTPTSCAGSGVIHGTGQSQECQGVRHALPPS